MACSAGSSRPPENRPRTAGRHGACAHRAAVRTSMRLLAALAFAMVGADKDRVDSYHHSAGTDARCTTWPTPYRVSTTTTPPSTEPHGHIMPGAWPHRLHASAAGVGRCA